MPHFRTNPYAWRMVKQAKPTKEPECSSLKRDVHSTLHTWKPTLHTPHATLRLYSPHSNLTLYTLHTLHTLHSTLCTPHSALHTPHSTLYTPHSTFNTLQFKIYTPHSTLYTPHSTLHTLPLHAPTHLLRTIFANSDVECNGRAKTPTINWHEEWRYI